MPQSDFGKVCLESWLAHVIWLELTRSSRTRLCQFSFHSSRTEKLYGATLNESYIYWGIIGNLSKHEGDGWRERHKTMTLHVRYRFWQNSNVKWPNSKFYVEQEHTTVNFLFPTWTVTPSLQSQLPDCSATLHRLNELKLSRRSLK